MTEVLIIWTNEQSLAEIFTERVDDQEFEKLILCAGSFKDTCDNGAYLEPLRWLSDWLIDRNPLDRLTLADLRSKLHFRRPWIVVCGETDPNLVPDEAAL